MLSNTLVTNEVKNAAGVEVEFSRISSSARSTEFAQANEVPSQPHRLSIAHEEVGTGTAMVRRSKVGFSKVIPGQVDTAKTAKVSAHVVLTIPSGNMTAATEAQNVLAELMSFLATTGAATTVLFDCTGNGAKTLVSGEL